MDQQSRAGVGGAAADGHSGPLLVVERLVLELLEELRDARSAVRSAEDLADGLRQELRDRDATISRLRQHSGEDRLRAAVRARVQDLLRRVEQLEKEP